MRIKIISCWNEFDWYNKKIGDVLNVVTGKNKHYSCSDDSYQVEGKPLAHIKKCDCEETNLPVTELQLYDIEILLKDYNMSKISKEEFVEKIQKIL